MNSLLSKNPLKEMPLASVVIRSWNALEFLQLTLTTLYNNTKDVKYELIIADDNSTPEVVSFLLDVDAKLVLNSRKVGAGEITCQGARIARGKYVAIIDNDVLLPEGWLGNLIVELEQHQAQLISPNRFRGLVHPDTGEALKERWYQMKSRQTNPKQAFLIFSGGRSITEFSQATLFASSPQARHLTCPPEFVGGSCIVYRRDFVERIGGAVDKAFYPYGSDDVDLCWRIGQANGKVLRSGKVHIHHFEHSSILENKLNYKKAVQESNQLLFSHWGGVLDSFINDQIAKGQSLVNLRSQYDLIDKYLILRNGTEIGS